jgi:hypothetical protein
LLVAAFVAELIRWLLFAIDLGPWFLVAMQALGGLTAVVIGILMPLVVAGLTKQSGRNNFTLGAVIMVGGVGAAVMLRHPAARLRGRLSDADPCCGESDSADLASLPGNRRIGTHGGSPRARNLILP